MSSWVKATAIMTLCAGVTQQLFLRRAFPSIVLYVHGQSTTSICLFQQDHRNGVCFETESWIQLIYQIIDNG